MAERDQPSAMEAKPSLPIDSALMNLLLACPAPIVNRMFITFHGTAARITFVEQTIGPASAPFVRGAISMSYPDLLSFRDLLIKSCSDIVMTVEPASETPGNG